MVQLRGLGQIHWGFGVDGREVGGIWLKISFSWEILNKFEKKKKKKKKWDTVFTLNIHALPV